MKRYGENKMNNERNQEQYNKGERKSNLQNTGKNKESKEPKELLKQPKDYLLRR